MKKTLLAGIAAFALVLGASGAGWADEGVVEADVEVGNLEIGDLELGDIEDGSAGAVSVISLQQTVTNSNAAGEEQDEALSGDYDMDFGEETFANQVLDVNNFQAGINQAQQGAVSVAVSVAID